MAKQKQKGTPANKQGQPSQAQSSQSGEAPQNQGVPLSSGQQNQAQAIDKQIEDFEQQLAGKSNSELKAIAGQLETVERQMLLEKIDNELKTMKEAAVKPGDGSSTAAAGASAAAATVINNSGP